MSKWMAGDTVTILYPDEVSIKLEWISYCLVETVANSNSAYKFLKWREEVVHSELLKELVP